MNSHDMVKDLWIAKKEYIKDIKNDDKTLSKYDKLKENRFLLSIFKSGIPVSSITTGSTSGSTTTTTPTVKAFTGLTYSTIFDPTSVNNINGEDNITQNIVYALVNISTTGIHYRTLTSFWQPYITTWKITSSNPTNPVFYFNIPFSYINGNNRYISTGFAFEQGWAAGGFSPYGYAIRIQNGDTLQFVNHRENGIQAVKQEYNTTAWNNSIHFLTISELTPGTVRVIMHTSTAIIWDYKRTFSSVVPPDIGGGVRYLEHYIWNFPGLYNLNTTVSTTLVLTPQFLINLLV